MHFVVALILLQALTLSSLLLAALAQNCAVGSFCDTTRDSGKCLVSDPNSSKEGCKLNSQDISKCCKACAAGTYLALLSQGATSCTSCSAGTYQSSTGQTSCISCLAGSYCPSGAASATPCPAGSYCPAGSSTPIPCPAGTPFCMASRLPFMSA